MALSSLYLDIEERITSPPGDSRDNRQKFFMTQEKRIDRAFGALIDPFEPGKDGDIWILEMEGLIKRIDQRIQNLRIQ